MKKRHKIIIQALRDLGGQATLKEISEKTGLNINGLSQSMWSIGDYVRLECLGGKGKDQLYKMTDK